jgi:chemotaxis signal transduction protein
MRGERPVLLRCHAGDDAFALEASAVRRVARMEESIDGRVDGLRVWPLTGLLGLDPVETGPVLVLDHLALAVTRVTRPTAVDWSELSALPAAARDEAGRLAGVARIEGELALVLDAGRLDPGAGAVPARWELPPARGWTEGARADGRALFFMGAGGARKTMFAVSYAQVVEAQRHLRFTRLRGANPCVAGLAEWRDRVVPVVDLEALAGVTGGSWEAERYLIVRAPASGDLFALPAGHCAAASLPLGEQAPVRSVLEPLTPWVKAAYALDNGYFIVPDLDRLAAAT